MKTSFIVGSLIGTALLLSGCYTVLMTPSVTEPAADSNEYYSGTASAAELNYGSNCLSCHSSSELDDRYDEMQSLGIHTVHGVVVDPYGWRNPETSIPWWRNLYAPAPIPASGVSQSSGGSTVSTPHTRDVGVTRGGGTSASPAPQAPSGGSSTAPATGNASSTSQQTQHTAQPSQPSGRERSGSDSSGTTRKTGSTRGSGK